MVWVSSSSSISSPVHCTCGAGTSTGTFWTPAAVVWVSLQAAQSSSSMGTVAAAAAGGMGGCRRPKCYCSVDAWVRLLGCTC